jgi:hypothetical protein
LIDIARPREEKTSSPPFPTCAYLFCLKVPWEEVKGMIRATTTTTTDLAAGAPRRARNESQGSTCRVVLF